MLGIRGPGISVEPSPVDARFSSFGELDDGNVNEDSVGTLFQSEDAARVGSLGVPA